MLLFMSLSWQCGAKSFIYLKFAFNQKEIAKTLCENRNKPKSCCAGKCVLDKELKKEDKRQSDLPPSLKDKIEKTEIFSGAITYQVYQHSILQELTFPFSNILLESFPPVIFHPPCLVDFTA
jgi:hypothetical protein